MSRGISEISKNLPLDNARRSEEKVKESNTLISFIFPFTSQPSLPQSSIPHAHTKEDGEREKLTSLDPLLVKNSTSTLPTSYRFSRFDFIGGGAIYPPVSYEYHHHHRHHSKVTIKHQHAQEHPKKTANMSIRLCEKEEEDQERESTNRHNCTRQFLLSSQTGLVVAGVDSFLIRR